MLDKPFAEVTCESANNYDKNKEFCFKSEKINEKMCSCSVNLAQF